MKKNKQINILIATERFPPSYSGAGLRAQRLIERMSDKYNLKFYVLCSRNFKKELLKKNANNANKYEVFRLNDGGDKGLFFPIYLIKVFFKVNYYLFNHKIDEIHFFSFSWLNRIIMFSNILFYKKKTILEITLDDSDDPISLVSKGVKNKFMKPFTKFLLKKIDKFVVLSEYSLDSCLKFNIPKEKIWLRPNPCDEKIFGSIDLSKKQTLRKKLNLPKNKFIMLNVGIIQPRKNQMFLLNLMTKLKNMPIILVMIGPIQNQFKDYYNALKKYVSNTNLSNEVVFLNEVDNINEYMIASDLFVFSSYSEGFPNTISEALTSGLPVLMTEIEKNGINKFIIEETGMTFKKTSSKDELLDLFALMVKKIYQKKIVFNRTRIRKYGIDNFSTKKIDYGYFKLYNNLARY